MFYEDVFKVFYLVYLIYLFIFKGIKVKFWIVFYVDFIYYLLSYMEGKNYLIEFRKESILIRKLCLILKKM